MNTLVYIVTSWQTGFMASTEYWIVKLGFEPVYMLLNPYSVYKIFTAMFTHANLLHIFFNMYFLYLFGRAVERALGHARYLALYLLSGVMAALFHTVFMFIQDPNGLAVPSVGASGAISGVLGAYMILFPGTRLAACFFLFIFPVCFELLAAYYLVFWFALQVLEGYFSSTSTVAFFAHAGGFIAGMALLPLLADRARLEAMRLYAGARRLFGVIVFLPQFYRHRGLNAPTKAVLLTLIGMLLAGSAAALAFTGSTPIEFASYSIAWRPGGGTVHQDIAFLGVAKARELATPLLEATQTLPARVLVKALEYNGLLYNPRLAGSHLVLGSEQLRSVKVEVPVSPFQTVSVLVRPFYFEGRYNQAGFLENSYTQATVIAMGELASVEARLMLTALKSPKPLIESMALLAVLTSLASMYVVAYRDEDYVITPE